MISHVFFPREPSDICQWLSKRPSTDIFHLHIVDLQRTCQQKDGWIEYFVDSFQTKEAQNKSLFTSMGAYLQYRKVHVYLSFYINTKNFYTSNKQIIPGWWVLDTLHNINFSLPHHGGHETRIIRQVATKIDPVAPLFAASKRLSILIIISFITASLWPIFDVCHMWDMIC